MEISLILLAFIPMIGWAMGDFFIQKSVKKTSITESLFYICLFSTLVGLPFLYARLISINFEELFVLGSLSLLIIIYAYILFHAFQVGKLSVVEAAVSFELPITVGLALVVGKETLTDFQLALILLTCVGIVLTSLKEKFNFRKHFLERGSLVALSAAGTSALTNFYIGESSKNIDPFFTIWFTHLIILFFCLFIIITTGKIQQYYSNLKNNKKIIFYESFFDNIGWFGYAYAASKINISLTVAISEAYIVLAAFLGYFLNKEKLGLHQKIGILISCISVITLAVISR